MTERKRPRTKCPYCGHKKAVTKTGKIYSHLDNGKRCGGSGQVTRA